MRRSNTAKIALVATVAVLSCGATIIAAPTPITAVLGIAMLGSLGYVWIQVLLDHRVRGLERVALGTGLAIATPILGGLALQAAGVPLHRAAWAYLLTGVTLLGDVLLAIRLGAAHSSATGQRPEKRSHPRPWQAVAYGSAAVIAVGAVGLARVGADIQHYPGFTELWLSKRTQAAPFAYLGVSNHQGGTEQYRLVLLHKRRVSAIWNLTLSNGQTWQRPIPIKGNYIKTADLYLLPDLAHPYRHVDTGGS
jgi:hypothetical protein